MKYRSILVLTEQTICQMRFNWKVHREIAVQKSYHSFGCIVGKDLGTTVDSSKK